MNGRRLVVGVTGGIAAYKTAAVVSRLVQGGVEVHVVMTRAAEKFIGSDTFAALTGRPVVRQMFGNARHPLGAHIDLANADLLCVAPATANFMARAAHGLAGDLLQHAVPGVQRPGVVRSGDARSDVATSGRAAERGVAARRRRGNGRSRGGLAQLPHEWTRPHGRSGADPSRDQEELWHS